MADKPMGRRHSCRRFRPFQSRRRGDFV